MVASAIAASLTAGRWFRGFLECRENRAVVREDHEVSALNEVAEMLDGQVDAEEFSVEGGIVHFGFP